MKKISFIATLIVTQSFFAMQGFAKTQKTVTPQAKYKYEQKVLRKQEKEKYKRSLLPESGYMTSEEYENLSRDISNSERQIPSPELPKDIKMKYVPQPIYKLGRYNSPAGSVELNLERKFKFDRQIVCKGVTSPNKDVLVYPVVYYYAANQCVSGDIFTIPLDKTLPDVERIKRANIIKRNPAPILSTDKDISEKFTFRTMTPVDFSPDGKVILAKEKIGNIEDGIWQTNLWVYNFETKEAKELCGIREAINYYWLQNKRLFLDQKRWDILPLGFSAENPDRIIVSAIGYTGKNPKFLGNWSIDVNGERSELVSLFEPSAKIVASGYKLVEDGVVDPKTLLKNEKKKDRIIKHKRKLEKKEIKHKKKQKKHVYKAKIKEMKHIERETIHEYNKQNRKHTVTGVD